MCWVLASFGVCLAEVLCPWGWHYDEREGSSVLSVCLVPNNDVLYVYVLLFCSVYQIYIKCIYHVFKNAPFNI